MIFIEAENCSSAFNAGLAIPKPPKRTGSVNICLSVFVACLPMIAGMNLSQCDNIDRLIKYKQQITNNLQLYSCARSQHRVTSNNHSLKQH